MNIVFKKFKDPNNEYDVTDMTMEVSKVQTLDEISDCFEDFLRGCGFSFKRVDIIVEEENE